MRIATVLALGALTACLPGQRETAVSVDDAPDVEPEIEEPAQYGPENSWWHALEDEVPGDLAGTGYREGDIAYDFTVVDQFGDEVQLYQFYGQVIVLDLFAEW